MRFYQFRTYVALILIFVIECEISWASKQCNSIVMDVHMKKYRLGTERAKRDLEGFDLQKYDGIKKQKGLDYAEIKDPTSHGSPQKRQLSPTQIGSITLPIVAEAVNGVAKARAYAASEAGQSSNPNLIGPTLGWSGLGASSPFTGGLIPFGTSVSQSPLGSILLLGKQYLVDPTRSIVRSIKLHDHRLKRFTYNSLP